MQYSQQTIHNTLRINIPKRKGGLKRVVYLGEQLRTLKEKLDISQDEMADTLCIGQSTLSKYMNNKAPTPFEFVIDIPKMIKNPVAKNIVFEWKKCFEEVFLKAITA